MIRNLVTSLYLTVISFLGLNQQEIQVTLAPNQELRSPSATVAELKDEKNSEIDLNNKPTLVGKQEPRCNQAVLDSFRKNAITVGLTNEDVDLFVELHKNDDCLVYVEFISDLYDQKIKEIDRKLENIGNANSNYSKEYVKSIESKSFYSDTDVSRTNTTDWNYFTNTYENSNNYYTGGKNLEEVKDDDIVIGNNSTSYSQYGNTVYGSDGSTYSQYGNTIYGNDGNSYSQYGNTVYGSDGSTCSKYGNTTYCN